MESMKSTHNPLIRKLAKHQYGIALYGFVISYLFVVGVWVWEAYK